MGCLIDYLCQQNYKGYTVPKDLGSGSRASYIIIHIAIFLVLAGGLQETLKFVFLPLHHFV